MSRQRLNPDLAVGLLVLAVTAVFGGFLAFFGNLDGRVQDHFIVHVRFRSLSSLGAGAPVKLAGRPVGTVLRLDTPQQTDTTRHHVADLRIVDSAEFREAIRTDSRFRIETEGVLGDQYVAITFGSDTATPLENDAWVWGEEPVDMTSVLADLQSTAANTAEVTRILKEGLSPEAPEDNPLAGVFSDLRAATENFARITTSIETMLGPGSELESVQISDILLELGQTVSNAQQVSEELRQTLAAGKEGGPDLTIILSDLQNAASRIAEVADRVEGMIGGDEEAPPVDIHQTLLNAEESAANLKEITVEIRSILDGMKNLYPPNWFK